jgi:hypothetical protein
MKPFLLIALALSLVSAKQIFLDDVMDKEEQKQTGVYGLTAKQKMALELWLNKNFIVKAVPTPERSAPLLTLSINIDNGRQLQLSDNSIWDVAPDDVARAAGWITPFQIRVIPSGQSDYPALLTNLDSNESIKARPGAIRNSPPPRNKTPEKPRPIPTTPQPTPTPAPAPPSS